MGRTVLAEPPGATTRTRSPEERERVLDAVVTLCEQVSAPLSEAAQGQLATVIGALLTGAPAETRRRLSERIAQASWTPRELALAIASDADEAVAHPVIRNSAALSADDLLELLQHASFERRLDVAQRPGLPPAVVHAVATSGDPSLAVALLNTPQTTIPAAAMATLLEASKSIAVLRRPLARRAELTAESARRLAHWCEVEANVEAPASRPAAPTDAAPDQAAEYRLALKLMAGGQLRPGQLIRALRERRPGLFAATLALLGGLELDEARAVLHSPIETLAYACVLVGVDRSAFPSLLALVRDLNGGRPGGDPADATVQAAFAASRDAAQAALTSSRPGQAPA